MLAEIASADRDLADVLFLIAVIVAGVGLGLRLSVRPLDVASALFAAAVGLVAAGLLFL